MKKIPILKSILGILLTLAVLGALVVAAVPVAAANTTGVTVAEGSNTASITTTSTPSWATLAGTTGDYQTVTGQYGTTYYTYSGIPIYVLLQQISGVGTLTNQDYSVLVNDNESTPYQVLVGPTFGDKITVTGNNTLIIADTGATGTSIGGETSDTTHLLRLICPYFSGGNPTTTPPTASSAGKYYNSNIATLTLEYTVSVSAPTHGSISPVGYTWNTTSTNPWSSTTSSGVVPVPYNGSQTFNITPASGYYVESLTVDGVMKPGDTSVTFSNVTGNHTLAATFFPNPVVSVSISPANQTVANGATFSVSLNVSTDTAFRGWQANINFDAARMTCTGVADGTVLSDWASANGDGTISAGSATISNTAGTIAIPGDSITGTANLSGPSGSNLTLCTISFTAKASVNYWANITIPTAVISDVNSLALPGVTLNGGTVSIGTVPASDLVVSAAYTTAVSGNPNQYTITYAITNQGNLAAGPFATAFSINGTPVAALAGSITGLAANTSTAPITTIAQTVSASDIDTIVITADSGNVITESNETNNTATTNYTYVPASPGNVQLNGLIQPYLQFTAPSAVTTWGSGSPSLSIGTNDAWGTMNVISNESWNVQVKAAPPSTGSMCLYNTGTSSYVSPLVQLGHALVINSPIPSLPISGITPISVTLINSNITLANGTPATQAANNSGDSRGVDFSQTVSYQDPATTGANTYQIIVVFTASAVLPP